MRVSVVICTYNRADGLRATIECLEQQRFREFEVVVVNGPSTDHTGEVLDRLPGRVKVVDNPLANLSISRNLGIRAAAGDVVAFIDDDALPEPAWLEQAVVPFGDPEIGGVGGVVIDFSGVSLQYRYSLATRFGEPSFTDVEPSAARCVPGSAEYPYLQGTNSLFKRSALAEIGLFDEVFDFYLDETDVCCRLVDAGYVLKQLHNAPVHHKYLPSTRRNAAKVVTNWSSIVRNHVYFGYRHALGIWTEFDILEHAKTFAASAVSDAEYHANLGVVEPGHVERTRTACGIAIADGIALGRERADLRLPPTALDPPHFVPFLTDPRDDRLRIALVSSGYAPSVTGGIARFISDVAPVLARRGHEVRVFARTTDVARVDLEAGVWVHRLELADELPGLVPEMPGHVDGFTTAVARELDRIREWWVPDIAYGSLWDVELLGLARHDRAVPIIPMLATPVAEVAEHEGWLEPSNPSRRHILTLVQLERELLARAAAVHAISDAIVTTMDRLYPGALHRDRVSVAHIGSADVASSRVRRAAGPPTVLFVGRLEPRKGIDTLLDAAPRLLVEHPDLRILIAGDVSRAAPDGLAYPDRWERDAVTGGDRLQFLGAVGDDELATLMRRALVVVVPSRYESFGLVVVEAMMHGRAVVASDIGGMAEIVNDGVTGVLVGVGDAKALARSIGALLTDPERAVEMGRAGRRLYESRFAIDVAAERLEALLQSRVSPVRSTAHGVP